MIKIDFKKIIYDHVWFGWYINNFQNEKPEWSHSRYAIDYLYPCREYGEVYPMWWFKLFSLVGANVYENIEYEVYDRYNDQDKF